MTEAAPRVAHPGAICPVQGETAVSKNGTPLYCRLPPGNPNAPHKRWGAVDPRKPKTHRRRGAARKGQGLEKRYIDQLTLEHDAPLPQQLLDQLDVKQLGALRTAGGLTWTGKKARKTDLDKLKRAGLLTDEGQLTSRGAEVLRQTGQLGEDGCDADERDAFERHGERPAPKPIVKGQPVDRSADAGTDWSAYDPCPKCPAEAGQPCHDLRAPGSLKATPHLGRMQSDMTPELKKALGEVYREPTLQIAGRAKDEFVGERVRIESTDNFGNPEVFEGVLEDVELPPEGPHNPWGGRPTAKVTLVGQEHPLPISPHAKVTVVAEAAPAEDRSTDAGTDWSVFSVCPTCGADLAAPCHDLRDRGSLNATPHPGRPRQLADTLAEINQRVAGKKAAEEHHLEHAPVAHDLRNHPDRFVGQTVTVTTAGMGGRPGETRTGELVDAKSITPVGNDTFTGVRLKDAEGTTGMVWLDPRSPVTVHDRSADAGVDWSRYKACPTCGTGPGEPCLDLRGDGSFNATAHDGRPVVAEEPAAAEPATVAEPVAEPAAAATAEPEPIDLDDPGLGTDDFTRDTLEGFSEGFLTPDEMVSEMITGDGFDPVVADAYVREAVDLHNHRNPDRPLPYPGEAKSQDRSAAAGTDWSKYADCHDCPAKAGAPCIDQAMAGSLNAIPHKGRPLLAGPAAEKPLAERITDVVDDLSTRLGGPVSLAELRNRLADVPREDLDQALLDLDDNRAIQLEPDPDRAGLTAADRDAAIPLVGQPQHLLRNVIRDPEDESLPTVEDARQAIADAADMNPSARRALFRSMAQGNAQAGNDEVARLYNDAFRQAEQAADRDLAERFTHMASDPSTAPIDMSRTNVTPFSENMWGVGPHHPVSYHPDGDWGNAVAGLGPDARVDYDGLPLREHLDRVATDVIRGDRTTNDAIKELRRVSTRLPEGTRARRVVDGLIDDIDYPMTPCPEVPEGAHPALKQLVRDIHAVPVARRDPSRELDAAVELARQSALRPNRAARLWASDIEMKVFNKRHESGGAEGKFDIDRAARRAMDAIDRAALEAANARRGS